MKIWIVLLLLFGLVGCSGASETMTPSSDPTADQAGRVSLDADPFVNINVNGIDLHLKKPDGWESYTTDYGIVLAENIASVAEAGQLEGLLMHVQVPPLEDLTMEAIDPSNLAWEILSEIIENPDYIGSAAVSAPFAFEWNGFDAAYYLVDNGDGNLSLVLGIAEPSSGLLITCHISAPAEQAHRIRDSLPVLLDNLTLNETALPGDFLNELPNPFEFPHHDADSGHNLLTRRGDNTP
jgi:hypothetical protein